MSADNPTAGSAGAALRLRDLWPATRTSIYFACICAGYLLFMLVVEGDWLLGGEMFAEMSVNYFVNANAGDLLYKLFATDAGYIPLPQRLIATAATYLLVPAFAIPYVYTLSAIVLSSMMVGVFCLPLFRPLVPSDSARALACFFVLVVANFDTRTFINFTYFALFFGAVLTAVAMVRNADDAPPWAWFLPLLMISKPHVLALVPAMAVAIPFAKRRFRMLFIAACAAGTIQFVRLYISRQAGVLADDATAALGASGKVLLAFKYFFGLLGGYPTGPTLINRLYDTGSWTIIGAGAGFLVLIAANVLMRRRAVSRLILVGLSLLFFTVLLNCFALSALWNEPAGIVYEMPLYRYTIPAYIACFLVFFGLVQSWFQDAGGHMSGSAAIKAKSFLVLFALWIVLSGWGIRGLGATRTPQFPTTNNSQWQLMAQAIDRGNSPLCIPVDPFGWLFARNCRYLAPVPNWSNPPLRFRALGAASGNAGVDVEVPPSARNGNLVSLAVFARPASQVKTLLRVKARIRTGSGATSEFAGERMLSASGGLILLAGLPAATQRDVVGVTLFTDVPTEFLAADGATVPAMLWMGE